MFTMHYSVPQISFEQQFETDASELLNDKEKTLFD